MIRVPTKCLDKVVSALRDCMEEATDTGGLRIRWTETDGRLESCALIALNVAAIEMPGPVTPSNEFYVQSEDGKFIEWPRRCSA